MSCWDLVNHLAQLAVALNAKSPAPNMCCELLPHVCSALDRGTRACVALRSRSTHVVWTRQLPISVRRLHWRPFLLPNQFPLARLESSREKEHEQASRRVHARPEAHVLLAVQHVGLTTDRASDLGDGLNAQLDSILSRRQGKKSESMPSSTACSP